MAPRRRPGRRTGWSKLSKPYRARLERQGITRSYWESGGDLRVARGHKPKRPSTAAPFEATMRMVSGAGTEADQQRLAQFRGPAWLPESLSYDVRAALSQLRGNPSTWAAVRFVPAPDGEPWGMVVTPKGSPRRPDGSSAYDQVILIPGGGAPGTGAREVLDLFYHPESSGVDPTSARWRGWTSETVAVAERISEATTGYGERSEVLAQIAELLEKAQEART